MTEEENRGKGRTPCSGGRNNLLLIIHSAVRLIRLNACEEPDTCDVGDQ